MKSTENVSENLVFPLSVEIVDLSESDVLLAGPSSPKSQGLKTVFWRVQGFL